MNVDDELPSVRGVQWRSLSERLNLCQTKRRSYIYLVVEPTAFEKYNRQNGFIFPK